MLKPRKRQVFAAGIAAWNTWWNGPIGAQLRETFRITKVGTVAGTFLLPICAYFGMRLFPLLMILRNSSSDSDVDLPDTSDGPAKCRPSAVLP